MRSFQLTSFVYRVAVLAALGGAVLPGAARCLAQATGPVQEADPDAEADSPADLPRSAPKEAEPAPGIRFDLIAGDVEHRIDRLIDQMTLAEKIGQLVQVYPEEDKLSEKTIALVRAGGIGSLFYPGDRAIVDEAQRIAVEESRLGIPLIIARDVVHGFRTVFPIPLGQAASWNPELVEQAARVAAAEARAERIDWTFAPMVDLCRDARWGRIAESLGEDPLLASDLAAAMVRGFQQEENGRVEGILACGKHFVGYGFSEGGRDYNRVSVSQADLHNVLLPPFRASTDAGCRTFMTTFSSVNGVPGTAHGPLLRDLLKRDWGFSGIVVSDWASVTEMVAHGFAEDNAHAAELAITAGVDMDMCSPAFQKNLERLVMSGSVPLERVEDAVRRVLRSKVELSARGSHQDQSVSESSARESAKQAAIQSVVLLKNDKQLLPLKAGELKRVAVIGPMADAPLQQLGCWAIDGKAEDSVTPLAELRRRLAGVAEVSYARGAKNTFSNDKTQITAAVLAAKGADVALTFIGEDAVLSGEARCRASLDLPGVQSELVGAVVETGTPTVLVVLSGRPLAIGAEIEAAGAVMMAWHPGTMAGPALGDLLFGDASPSGKLPVTIPRSVGQSPIYYNHTNTGRPPPPGYKPLLGSGLDDLPEDFQYSSHYVDEEPTPLLPFGYGLTYTEFSYSATSLSKTSIGAGETITARATVTNTGDRPGIEVVQLYLRDLVGGIVRPVRELKGHQRVTLAQGESRVVEFTLNPTDLGYYNAAGRLVLEPGKFRVGIGGDSTVELLAEFAVQPRDARLAPLLPAEAPTAGMPAGSIR